MKQHKAFGALPLLILFFFLSLAASGARAASETVFPYGSICDRNNQVCFRGRIDFDINRKVISIRGQVYRSAGEGTLVFQLIGVTPLEERVFLPVEVKVRGNYSESISHQYGPPHSNRTEWYLDGLVFRPAD